MPEALERRIRHVNVDLGLFQNDRLAALDRPTTTKGSPEQFPHISCAFSWVLMRLRIHILISKWHHVTITLDTESAAVQVVTIGW